MVDYAEFLVQVSRLGLAGKNADLRAYLRRIVKKSDADLAAKLRSVLADAPPALPVRDAGFSSAIPVDSDTRLALLRQEYPVRIVAEPILQNETSARLQQVVNERGKLSELDDVGLSPSRTLLFSGPPGVGKTLSARWLARQLDWPLLTLDLATVMSSYLGKTGSNIRAVLDFAKTKQCVLLLDEFDAVAKRRDDDGDVGELKRLVNVLLQEIDEWPATSVLVAATNHPGLLDPAIWRRFDDIVDFATPDKASRNSAVQAAFGPVSESMEVLAPFLVDLWEGRSYSDIVRIANWVRRRALVGTVSVQEAILEAIGRDLKGLPANRRKQALSLLAQLEIPDRKISALAGVSRDTLRKYRASEPHGDGAEKETE